MGEGEPPPEQPQKLEMEAVRVASLVLALVGKTLEVAAALVGAALAADSRTGGDGDDETGRQGLDAESTGDGDDEKQVVPVAVGNAEWAGSKAADNDATAAELAAHLWPGPDSGPSGPCHLGPSGHLPCQPYPCLWGRCCLS